MEKYFDKALSTDERVENLLSLMTLEEKVGQMMQLSRHEFENDKEKFLEWKKCAVGSYLHVLGEEADEIREYAQNTRLKIPPLFGIDAIHGHTLYNGATIFPSQLSMSCSFNKCLIREMGRVTAKEMAADGLEWAFSPVLCIARDQRWGRVDETFGEDSYVIGELGEAIIDGYQCDNYIIACAKHYIGYGEATGGRDAYDSPVSYRKIREVCLPPFKKAVDIGCKSMMTAYGSIDGVPLTANKKMLRDVLKDELGFDGFVVTDWMNIRSLVVNQHSYPNIKAATKSSIIAGNDMTMNVHEVYDCAIELVNSGELPVSYIDDAVRRILRVKFSLGMFDGKEKISKDVIACKAHTDINYELTKESMVLLKNENNTLPLKDNIKTIAVIGPNADDLRAQYGDWTFFTHPDPKPDEVAKGNYFTMLSGIKKIFKNSEILYSKGCDVFDENIDNIDEAVKLAESSDAVICVVGDNMKQNGEFRDRANCVLGGKQLELLKALKSTGKKLIAVLVNSKPLCISWLKDNCDAIIESFSSGDFGGLAVAELIHGDYNPSGKLTISFPYTSAQMPCYYNDYTGWHGNRYSDLPSGVVYQFGYGLSYSEYEYSNIAVSKSEVTENDEIIVSVDVTNKGTMDGKETVQLYINDVISTVLTSKIQLKGFKKVLIKAGETQRVEIPLKIKDLYLVDQDENYIVEPGTFEIMIGKNCYDGLKTTIEVK